MRLVTHSLSQSTESIEHISIAKMKPLYTAALSNSQSKAHEQKKSDDAAQHDNRNDDSSDDGTVIIIVSPVNQEHSC